MAAPAFASTPPTIYPALPLDQLMAWQRQVFANTDLRPSRKIVAAALATYHNSQTGWTFPSLRTIARVTGHHVGTVIASYRDLEAEGHLEHIERYRADTRGRDSHQYTLKLRGEVPANGNARRPAEVVGSAEHPCSDPPSTPCSAQPNITTEPLNDKDERADDAGAPVPEGPSEPASPPAAAPISDNRLDRLARRVQRLANGKGWRLDNARATVLRALKRAGVEAVERTIVKLEDGDQRPAYVLQGILDGLRCADAVVAPSGRAAGPQDAAWKAAEVIYLGMAGGGVVDFSARMRVQKAVQKAGIADLRWQDRANTVSAIAAAIRAGTLDPRG